MRSPAKINIYTFPLTCRWNIVLLIYEAGTKNMSQRPGLSVIFYLLIWICSSKCQKCEVLRLDSSTLASSTIKDTFFVSPLDWRDKAFCNTVKTTSTMFQSNIERQYSYTVASWSWSTAGPANSGTPLHESWKLLPVKSEFFIPTVAKCFLKGNCFLYTWMYHRKGKIIITIHLVWGGLMLQVFWWRHF